MFERFSESGRRVVVLAQEEARGLGHGFIGDLHLLLAVWRAGGPGIEALVSAGATLDAARAEVRARAEGPALVPGESIPFTPAAKQALEGALRECMTLGSEAVGAQHVLLALIADESSAASDVLASLGIDREALRRALVEVDGESGGEREPARAGRVSLRPRVETSGAGGFRRVSMVGPFGDAGARRCGFCGRRESSVAHLVRAREVFICDACVTLAREAIVAAPAGQVVVRIKPRPPRPADRDAAELAVEDAFEAVFGSDTDFEARCAAIEGGSNLGSTMQEVSERFTARSGLDVVVDHVRFLGDQEAEVSFTLLFGGGAPGPMGPVVGLSRLPEVGYAVLVDGVWRVARETYCRLVQRVGVQCPPPPA